MLSRATTVANAVAIILLAVPIVWAVGYQDHPWRHTRLATAASLLLIGAAVAIRVAGSREDPPVGRVLTGTALVASCGALVCALFWAWAG